MLAADFFERPVKVTRTFSSSFRPVHHIKPNKVTSMKKTIIAASINSQLIGISSCRSVSKLLPRSPFILVAIDKSVNNMKQKAK